MSSLARAALSAIALIGTAHAQQTYIVDWQNSPGTHFTNIPAALAVAVHGDTILVKQGGYQPGTTDQGISIVSVGRASQIYTNPTPFVVQNLPAGRTFRMAGFYSAGSSPFCPPFFLHVNNCQGEVYVDDLHGDEHGFYPLPTPSFWVVDSAYVSFNNCENFGAPALSAERSTVSVNRSYLGRTSIGLGGCTGIVADSSDLYVSEPLFDAIFAGCEAIQLTNCNLVLTGSANSYVQGGYPFGGGTATPAITAQGGTIVIDPTVPLNPFVSGPGITGTATVTTQTVPGAFTSVPLAGTTMQLSITAPVTTPVVSALSLPMAPVPSPFGTLWLDLSATLVLAAGNVPASGIFTSNLLLPASVPPGTALTHQAVTGLGGLLVLSTGAVFVIR